MNHKWIFWLQVNIILVFAMIGVGAVTRLTDSGLSMVEWRPLMGWFPPLSLAEWERIFTLYRQTSQYQLMNHGFSLGEFQTIFWWEYIHRLLGRVIGIAYGLPFIWWALTKNLPKKHEVTLFLLLLLGAAQGFIGWWMVKSGFANRTEVSQVRLAIHLGMAFILFASLIYVYLDLRNQSKIQKPLRAKPFSLERFFLGFIPFIMSFITILAGALVAGAHAGYIFNDWPLFDGQIWPDIYWDVKLGFHSLYMDLATIQMNHRLLAYGLLCVLSGNAAYCYFKKISQHGAFSLLIMGLIQALLGVLTLIYVIPLPLALLHQLSAAILFALSVRHFYLVTR